MAWLDWVSPEWEQKAHEDVRNSTLRTPESLRRQHGQEFACLPEVLSHSDPIGLIAIGFPPDEYVPEAEHIYEGLSTIGDQEALQDLMYGVFVRMFDASLAGPRTAYEEPARNFWHRCRGRG